MYFSSSYIFVNGDFKRYMVHAFAKISFGSPFFIQEIDLSVEWKLIHVYWYMNCNVFMELIL